MKTSFASVKLPTALVDAARVDAALFGRSISGQVTHWARLGCAIETAARLRLSSDRVRAALSGEFNADALSESERELFDALIDDAMAEIHTPQERVFLASFDKQSNTDNVPD